jgi:transposase-like protein
MKPRKTRSYDKEFKLNAVKLYLKSGRGFKQIADELGIPFSTLVGWVFWSRKSGHIF